MRRKVATAEFHLHRALLLISSVVHPVYCVVNVLWVLRKARTDDYQVESMHDASITTNACAGLK
jgi:hypothetical protein